MKVCPQCKAEFADDLNFCLQDGTVLEEKGSSSDKTLVLPVPPTQAWNDKTEQTVLRQGYSSNQMNQKSKVETRSNSSSLPLVIIGLVLIAAFGGAWWLYSRNTSQKGGITANNSNKAANTTKTPTTAPELGAQPPNMLGSPNAAVTVEEFADFQCPTCGAMHPKFKELQALYGSRIKFIFRNYPLAIPAHDKAYDAAVAAESAGLQGSDKFWAMQNLLFTNQQAWSSNPDYRKVWEGYASQIGLDVERFKNDMAGLNAKSRVDADLKRGRALNVSSTPSLFINGMLVPFAQMESDTLRQIIDGELQKAQANQQGQTTNAPTNSASTEVKK